MLYPHQIHPNCLILIDRNRPSIPPTTSDVVPVFPKKHAMIMVRGDDDEWLAHIQIVDTRLRRCVVMMTCGWLIFRYLIPD